MRRIAWACERAYLRHGVVVPVLAIGCLVLVVLLVEIGWSYQRIMNAEQEIDYRSRQVHLDARPDEPRAKIQALPLPLPALSRRFVINQRVIAALRTVGFEPERIRFKFDVLQDAGLTRQVASFTLTGRWDEVAKGLSALQAADRSLYIARLRLSRQSLLDDQVSAEIQLAVALVDDPHRRGGP